MLSDLQTRKLTRYFHVYDIDDDGRIEASDFARIVENVRVLHGEEDGAVDGIHGAYRKLWDRISEAADADGDRGIDLDEWLAYWQVALEDDARYEDEVEALTERLFAVFDMDDDDSIGPAEFADFYGMFGLPVSLAETVFAELDQDQDGRVTRDELRAAGRAFFRSDDVEEAGNLLFGPYGA
jgi:Ca2+-binding EF-hand superfamily protein